LKPGDKPKPSKGFHTSAGSWADDRKDTDAKGNTSQEHAMFSILLSDTFGVTVLCEACIRSNHMLAWECSSVDSWAGEESGSDECISSSPHANNLLLVTMGLASSIAWLVTSLALH